ncbi:TPA: class B sortase [Clostridioides difficile]|nr:class B sortase [Clostridioides difficile]
MSFFISIYNISISIIDYNNSRQAYRKIRNEKEYTDLYSINSDYIGWINIENTPINYPIMKGNDNEFYLNRGFDKQYLRSGSIFMDYRNTGFQDKNMIIYGHHMKDQSMFGSLKKFKGLDYLQKNKYIHITTKENENLMYEVFAVYVTDANDTGSISTQFNTKEEFTSYIKLILSKSIYNPNINIKDTDRILTLSTCSYEFSDARLVVHAKLIN